MTEVKSEIAGVIDKVLVCKGERVEAGQRLATIESMKMVMGVKAPVEGYVKEVRVSDGDFVQEGDVLIVLEIGG